MQQSILQIIFNLRPLEIQRSTQICTYRYWGIQACGALHQTRVAIELARAKTDAMKQEENIVRIFIV